MTRFTPSSDEVPAVDRAETASGHPHTLGVEYTDDEVLIASDATIEVTEFGELPDIETHDYDEPHTL